MSEFQTVSPGFKLATRLSRHTGTGGYVLSRNAARELLKVEKFNLPVDHILFSPNTSLLFSALKPRQLIPAILRQREFVGEKSDIEPSRRELRAPGWAYVKRKLKRSENELRLLPRQITSLLSRRARLIRILTEST